MDRYRAHMAGWMLTALTLLLPEASSLSLPSFTQEKLIVDDAVTFRTRPEIAAPRWDVRVTDPSLVYPGYWFVPSYKVLDQKNQRGEGWVAPYIYDEHGEVIWCGAYLTQGYDVFDFKLSRVLGQDMITMISPQNGSAYVLDTSFNIRHTIRLAEDGEEVNMHELNFVNDGNRVVFFYDRTHTMTDYDSETVGFTEKNCQIKSSGFRELDATKDWNRLNDWILHEHIYIPENTKTTLPPTSGCLKNWDFAHANSLDKFPDGSYLMSVRHTDTIYRIATDGSIMWRLGGKISDFVADFYFSRQHDARILEHNDTHTILSLFDNAIDEDHMTPTAPYSRGLVVSLRTDVEPKEAYILGEIQHPGGHGNYTVARANMQNLPNGNFLVNWVDGLMISEYTPDGRLIMQSRVKQDWLKSYRSYKFAFIGKPSQPPDVYATTVYNPTSNTVHTLVYVSWNGATEVAKWNIYKTNAQGDAGGEPPIAKDRRNGFETFLNFKGYATYVVAEAIGKDGSVLGRSNTFETIAQSYIPDKELIQEALWLGINPPVLGKDRESADGAASAEMFAATRSSATFRFAVVCAVFVGVAVYLIKARRASVFRRISRSSPRSSPRFSFTMPEKGKQAQWD